MQGGVYITCVNTIARFLGISRPELASICYFLTTEPTSRLSENVQAVQPVQYLLQQSTKFPGPSTFSEPSQSCVFRAVFTERNWGQRQIQGALHSVPLSVIPKYV